MTLRDQRPVETRAAVVVREAEWEADGVELRKCECGTAEVETTPGTETGMRCAGCKREVLE